MAGRLLDVGVGGAALAWDRQAPAAGASLAVEIDGVAHPVALAWANCTRFGVRFAGERLAVEREALTEVPLAARAGGGLAHVGAPVTTADARMDSMHA